MRLLALFKKTMIENVRDWKILILTLSLAPFFVLVMHLYYGDSSKPLRLIYINHDQGVLSKNGNTFNAGKVLFSELKKAKHPNGKHLLEISLENQMSDARKRLENKYADLAVEIPEHFSRTLMDYIQGKHPTPVRIKTVGDPTNMKYILAVSYCDYIAYQYTSLITGLKSPIELQAETIGGIKSLNVFDLYIPALLALALICMMFTACASFIKEKDKGTIIRLRMSNMRIFEFLASISLAQIIIGLLALLVTFLTIQGMGYKTSGSLIGMCVIGLLSSLAIIAISLLVAALLRTIFDLMTIGCFPFFILMFFSGGMLPLPSLQLFIIGSYTINVNDILPTTHTISALGKILNYGAGLGEVIFEMGAIVVLTVIYFVAGMWLFNRRHLKAK